MRFIVSLLILLSIVLTIGCSEIKDDITLPETIGVHPEGFGDASSSSFHKFVFRESNWSFNLTKCQSCHAANYDGGTTEVSCLTCHTEPTGPEACNTCHGVFANPDIIAPPNDLEDNSDSGSKGVGAHYKHAYNNSLSNNIGCFECHQQTISNDKFVHSHISPPPAKMEFGEFTHPDSLGLIPEYDFTNITCSNTYCHGAFKFGDIVGNNRTVVWNSTTEKEAKCGTCHGEVDADGNTITPLPTGHSGSWTISQCSICHGSVVNSEGIIIDKFKHINKQIDF
jgi:predicted CxxxxCH...CXXCH cytochrome family protein